MYVGCGGKNEEWGICLGKGGVFVVLVVGGYCVLAWTAD